MKKKKTLYRVFTGLFAFVMLGSAIPDILSVPAAVEGFQQIGMPTYLLPFSGIAKTLGVLAILLPVNARIKERAYAGLVFDLTGATYAIIASGQPASSVLFMLLPLGAAACSYLFYRRFQHAKQQGTFQQAKNEQQHENAVLTTNRLELQP